MIAENKESLKQCSNQSAKLKKVETFTLTKPMERKIKIKNTKWLISILIALLIIIWLIVRMDKVERVRYLEKEISDYHALLPTQEQVDNFEISLAEAETLVEIMKVWEYLEPRYAAEISLLKKWWLIE